MAEFILREPWDSFLKRIKMTAKDIIEYRLNLVLVLGRNVTPAE
jgi:hypothetical protein